MADKVPGLNAHTTAGGLDLYERVGGRTMCRELATAFYAGIEHDPLLRPLFPGKNHHCAIEEFAAFLAQLLGGPSEDAQRRWWLSLRDSHARFKIGPAERAAWMKKMLQTLDDVQSEEPVRTALREFFERSSAHVVNRPSTPPEAVEPNAPVGNGMRAEFAHRWNAQRALDEVVTAIRCGDSERAIGLAETPVLQTWFRRDRSVLAGLLALMIASGDKAMLRYVEEKITDDPALVRVRYAARTLLHQAAARGRLNIVELLLRLGADPNVNDGGAHTPLYSVANECSGSEGPGVVRALVHAGANVNADDGVKHCTALHMAARRGNVKVADALLDCGADIEARDSLGETPLRRSVNCGKTEVAALLLSRGANLHTQGSKRLTPLLAARSRAMKELLQSHSPGNTSTS